VPATSFSTSILSFIELSSIRVGGVNSAWNVIHHRYDPRVLSSTVSYDLACILYGPSTSSSTFKTLLFRVTHRMQC
jgi:hypothetical protein